MIVQSVAAACGGLIDSLMPVFTGLDTLVVHCSDGRFAGPCDRFAQRRFELSRYDRLVVPGGAAWLADPERLSCEAPASRSALEMLVELHRLRRVVMIAHADCAFYQNRLGIPPERCIWRQRADMLRVGRWLRERYPRLLTSGYYAAKKGRRVTFQRVFGAPIESV